MSNLSPINNSNTKKQKIIKNKTVKKKIKIIEPVPELVAEELVEEPIVEEPVTEQSSIELQLGDIIQLTDPRNERINDEIFMIEYIDSSNIHLVNTENFDPLNLTIQSNHVINGITKIALLSRANYPGYAKQNNLVPGKWINIYFNGNVPSILTGEITNLEEDMIEIKTYPDKETIYINFEYKGLPEDLPIEKIEIRNPPETEKIVLEELPEELQQEKEEMKETAYVEPQVSRNVNNQLRQVILNADQIIFGKEVLGAITQYVDVGESKQRYSIDVQLNDLLNDLLSTIPTQNRTKKVLNGIHIMIERYKQLRSEFSSFDEYGNINGKLYVKANDKPLLEYLEKFNRVLYWILPVVQNVKKIYDINPLSHTDVTTEDIQLNLKSIEEIMDNYRNNNYPEEQNKYEILLKSLDPYFTPFEPIEPETDFKQIIIDKNVNHDLNVLINNLSDYYSSAVSIDYISSKQFLFERYNTGITKLETLPNRSISGINTSGVFLTNRIEITDPNVLSIQSILTLPEPMVRFSQINLPGTSILERANLNLHFLDYWSLLNKNSKVKKIVLDNLNEDFHYEEDEFLQEITDYSLADEIVDAEEFQNNKIRTREEKYSRFIEHIIPKTRILFHLIRKYIHGKLSIVNVVSYLEPFLIYTKDISYMQYIRITRFIYEKIRNYNRNFSENSAIFSTLKRNKNLISNMNKERTNLLLEILHEITVNEGSISENEYDYQKSQDKEKINLKTEVIDEYHISKNEPTSSLEFIRTILLKDSGRFYFSGLSIQMIDLMFSDDFSNLLENDKNEIQQDLSKENKGNCEDVVIAKMYANEDELMADNEVEIYFDQKYDTTNYSLLEKYETDMIQMPTEDFIVFLMNELQKKLKLSKEEAENLSETLISGFKRVIDGQYAIIHKATPEGEYKFVYYKRKNNRWTKDDELSEKGIKTDNGGVLCNLQEKCISVVNSKSNHDDKCEPIEVNELQLKENLVKNLLNEFDHQYESSKLELKRKLTRKFLYYQHILPILSDMEWKQRLKSNHQKYKIGLKMEKEEENGKSIILSPYSKLRDLILGQQDFIKKQNDIIRFVTTYTREAYLDIIGPLGEKETVYWLYCIETNVKLLPRFLFILASTWMNEPQNYLARIKILIKEIGVGDEGDSWVDKHSGYIICKIDPNAEEGFEDGFRVSTRAVLEEDIEDKIRNSLLENGVGISDKERKIIQNTPEMRMINNVINAICTAMGISLEKEKEWMISDITILLEENVPEESSHNKEVLEMSKKGKLMISFKDYYHTLLLYYTLGMIILAIQTSIPSIRTRRTFPGCIRSFSGYPFEGVGDLSSINYLACIVYKIRSSSEPWKVVAKKKEGIIASKIKDTIDEYLLGLDNVKRKTQEKMEYLIMGNEEGSEIKEEYDVRRWIQFLPPIIPFKIKGLQPVSPEFEKTLLHEFKSGSSLQKDKIGVMEGKIILFSLSIQEKINQIVQKKDVVLRKMTNEPYLENACCNENSGEEKRISTLEYFEKEDPTISQYNQIVLRLTNVFKDISFYSSASLLYSPFNTKNIYPSVDMKFSERTIYKAFIDFCHFQSLKPIPADILPLCVNKPDFLKSGENLTEMIVKMKNDGRHYSYENFLRLLQIFSRNRIIKMDTEKPLISNIQNMRDVIETIQYKKDERKDDRKDDLIKLLVPLLDTYEVGVASKTEINNLNNYLSRSIDTIKADLIRFISTNKNENITKKMIKTAIENIQTFNMWEITKNIDSWSNKISVSDVKEKKSVYRILEFYKEYIENFVRVFPSIIQHRLNYQNIQLPKYWGLSKSHNLDITKSINEYYEDLQSFYDTNSLTVLLTSISRETEDLLLLSEKTPCLSSGTTKDGTTIQPIFDERTSKMLFEYYLLKVLRTYVQLTDDNNMIVVKNINASINENENLGANRNNHTYKERMIDEPIFTNDYLEEVNTNLDTIDQSEEKRSWINNTLFIGDKKELKQKTSELIIQFLQIFQKHKDMIDVSYEKIQDRVFQLKQKEKDTITDRLKGFSDEKRDVDTLLKINKLGDWGKGLQKGLTTYVKENYDGERDFMEKMMQYERDFSRKRSPRDQEEGENLEDYIDQSVRDQDAEKEAYDISNMTEDYMDGYEPDGYEEEENYGDYN